jgi:glycosyltransferase involved in cell wall biosynthesis
MSSVRHISIANVHAGSQRHGVHRYGRRLAGATSGCAYVSSVDVSIPASTGPIPAGEIRRIRRTIRAADIIHIQFNVAFDGGILGDRWWQIINTVRLLQGIHQPVVVSVHDAYESSPWPGWTGIARLRLAMMRRRLTGRPLYIPGETMAYPQAITLRWLSRRACLVVCTTDEEKRLKTFLPDATVQVIPHFVEKRLNLTDSEKAKDALGLVGRRVLTVLGFVHPRKGHHLAVAAMAKLPEDITLVVAGTATEKHLDYATSLMESAHALGVAERVIFTGFLDDDVLDLYLAATDLALCPFERVAASGSVATWIAANRPILGLDLPLFHEYQSMSPGSMLIVGGHDSCAIAEGIQQALDADTEIVERAMERLREQLDLSVIACRHIDLYRRSVAAADKGTKSIILSEMRWDIEHDQCGEMVHTRIDVNTSHSARPTVPQ